VRVTLLTIIVEDQTKAHAFYRDILGFVTREDIDVGNGARWITLASPEDPDGARVSLEPRGYPYVNDFQDALKANNVPLTAFMVADLQAEYRRLTDLGVEFRGPPSTGDAAMPAMATFDDQCGNWIMLYEAPE
jgi:catechol 2,3-dioxygenase-like lactoylglutathione lyase family enzyme